MSADIPRDDLRCLEQSKSGAWTYIILEVDASLRQISESLDAVFRPLV